MHYYHFYDYTQNVFKMPNLSAAALIKHAGCSVSCLFWGQTEMAVVCLVVSHTQVSLMWCWVTEP